VNEQAFEPEPLGNRALSGGRGREAHSLDGVLTLAPDDVWIGGQRPNIHDAAAIEHWDGTSWQFVPTPKITSGIGAFSSSSPTDIWAVAGTGGGFALLHWDGQRWMSFDVAGIDETDDVAVVSPREAWLVSPLAHWDGNRWKRVRALAFDGRLNAIAMVSASEAWVAGFKFAYPGPSHSVLAHGTCLA
jgi:hypothetical protein